MNQNIIFCGVGGQGTVLASKLTAAAAMGKGYPVMSAETIGMAQKGGSVFSHLRIGENVLTPMIRPGGADVIIAFEPGEAVKMLPYLKQDGLMVVNPTPVMPVGAALKGAAYDGKEMLAYLRENCKRLVIADCEPAIRAAGSPKCMNIAMLAVAASTGEICISPEELEETLRKKIPERYLDINIKALKAAIQKEIVP